MKSVYRYGKGVLLGGVIVAMLAACSSTPKVEGPPSAEEFYQRGVKQLQDNEVSAAAMTLDEMEMHYPVNVETADLHMALLKRHEAANNPEATVLSAHRFVNMFPAHEEVDYAYYAGGMANFERGLAGLTPAEGEQGNPEFAKESYKSFTSLLKCCPGSEYAGEAKEKSQQLHIALADYELSLMEDEFRNGQVEAGTDRGWYIVSNFEGTAAATRALAILNGEIVLTEPEPEPVIVMPEPEPEPEPELIVNYVIQVASYKDLDGLKQAVSELGLEGQVQIQQRTSKGASLYCAVYGGYEDEAAAAQDFADLKARLGIADLWLRKAGWSQPLE